VTTASRRPGASAQIAGLIFAVVLVDPDLKVADANPAAESLLGSSIRRLRGRPLFDVLNLADMRIRTHSEQVDVQFVARGVMVEAGGRSRKVNLTLSPLASHPGWRVVTISEAGQDEMRDADQQQVALRGPAILAHEIKNPLAAIRGAGQLLARKLDAREGELARVIENEVDRIASLIDRMQRLGSAVAEPVAPFNLHEAIRNALATVRSAGGGDVRLVEEFDPSLPPVLGHRDALEQVIINLLTNAIHACAGSRTPEVIVKTRFVSGFVVNAIRLGRAIKLPIEVTVSDNGPGIDPDVVDHVFEPFVTSRKGGQGLGLPLVKKLVRDMDGRIAHDRDEKAGLTHFRIHLPAAR